MATVHELVRARSARHPEPRTRLAPAKALTGGVTKRDGGLWSVESTGGRVYLVQADPVRRESSCTCEDYRRTGGRCKHQLAVALVYMTAC